MPTDWPFAAMPLPPIGPRIDHPRWDRAEQRAKRRRARAALR